MIGGGVRSPARHLGLRSRTPASDALLLSEGGDKAPNFTVLDLTAPNELEQIPAQRIWQAHDLGECLWLNVLHVTHLVESSHLIAGARTGNLSKRTCWTASGCVGRPQRSFVRVVV